MNKKIIILIGSLFFMGINVLAMTTDSVLQLIQTLPMIQSDVGSEFQKWESTYDYLKKLEFNEDARKIINAIAQKYEKITLPKAGKEIINSVVKKGADDLCKHVEQHEFMLKNRKIRTLSDFIVNLNGINAIIEISKLGLEEGLKDYIASLEFNDDSCGTILSMLALFNTYATFPGKISGAIVEFMQKEAQHLIKDMPNQQDDIGIKQLYNDKVDKFVKFVVMLNDKKKNLIQIKLPSKVIIPAAWESSATLKNVKNALLYIKNLEGNIYGLKPAELIIAKKNIEPNLNSLNGNIGPKGAITNYLKSEDGKKDDDFISLLMKAMKILEKWYEEGEKKATVYHKLWEYLNSHKPEIVPPMPPRPVVDDPAKPLKDKLVLLKRNLSLLKGKLQGLAKNLDALRDKLVEANPLTESEKTQITKQWTTLRDDFTKNTSGKTGQVYQTSLLMWKNANGNNKNFIKKLSGLQEAGKIQLEDEDVKILNKIKNALDID